MIKRAFYLSTLIFVVVIFIYLAVLSFDLYRLKHHKVLNGRYQVHVFDYGWHTGLVIETRDLPDAYRPYFQLLGRHRFIEISWGDALFYQDRSPGINWWLALRAMLWPTKSVLHIVGFDQEIEDYYRWTDWQTIYLNQEGFNALLSFVCSYFLPEKQKKYRVVNHGLYGDSWFLASKGLYVFPVTCNVWTARALKSAKMPLTPYLYQSSRLLMYVLSVHAKQLKSNRKTLRYVQF